MILLLPLVIASPAIYYSENEEINIQVPCSRDGFVCSAGADCNITVSYPNTTILINSQAMENNGNGIFNYSITRNLPYGEYVAFVYCSDYDKAGFETFNFKINAYGEDSTNMGYLISFFIFLAVLSMALTIFFYVHNGGLRHMFLIMTFIFSTVCAYLIYQISKEWGNVASNVVYTIFWTILILTFVIFLLCLVEWTIILIKWLNGNKKNEFGDNLV
jgi:hypothetical protein